jgi:UDP-GlcNAc:undecaprenyl-phosphate/decaprenyl-phosphate GlcNAc-1-phosphate transferase
MELPFGGIALSPFVSCLLAGLMAVIVSFIAIPAIVRIARNKNLMDVPNGRTSHSGMVPSLGGVAIFAGLMMGASLFLPKMDLNAYRYMLGALLIVFFIGQKDDIESISARTKFIAQLFAAFLVVIPGDFRIMTLHGFLNIHDIPDWASVVMSIMLIIIIINAFNLIDGIDGLASGIGISTAGFMGLWLYGLEYYGMAVVAAALVGGLIPFFIFNVFGKKNKLFMGDTGSLVIGLLVSVFTLQVCSVEIQHDLFLYMKATPAVAIAILIFPLFDLIRVFSLRLSRGKSPFQPDRGHIHHLVTDAGLSHRRSTFFILLFNLVAIGTAWFMRNGPIMVLGLMLLVGSLLVTWILWRMGRKRGHGDEGTGDKK